MGARALTDFTSRGPHNQRGPGTPQERPTHPLVEVHLLDFSGDLYGARIELEFVQHIRTERRFENLETLQEQIGRDAASARRLLDS